MDRKALVLTSLFCLTPAFAHADGRDDLLRALRKCAALTDAPERLACYDHLSPQFAPPTQAAAAPPSPEEVEKEKESWFGLGNLFGGGEEKPQATPKEFGEERVVKTPQEIAKAQDEQIDSITSKLADYALNPYGKFTVFLANGQIWTQLQGDTGKARFDRNARNVTVTVERAIFGTYSMKITGNTMLFKVKRVK